VAAKLRICTQVRVETGTLCSARMLGTIDMTGKLTKTNFFLKKLIGGIKNEYQKKNVKIDRRR